VFILQGLRRGEFVSVVDARVTESDLLQNGERPKIRVDSIGLTGVHIVNRGSADSKGVTGRFA